MTCRPGAILLEVLLSLALFVVTSLTLLSVISQSIEGLRRSQDRLLAADHARNAMAQIEGGIARPETLNGPVAPWNERQEETIDPSFIGFDPDDAPAPEFFDEPAWALEIETEPTEHTGLMLVSVRAHRIDETGYEYGGAPSFTLRQFVRLSPGEGSGEDEAGSFDLPSGFAAPPRGGGTP